MKVQIVDRIVPCSKSYWVTKLLDKTTTPPDEHYGEQNNFLNEAKNFFGFQCKCCAIFYIYIFSSKTSFLNIYSTFFMNIFLILKKYTCICVKISLIYKTPVFLQNIVTFLVLHIILQFFLFLVGINLLAYSSPRKIT